jgi:deoxyribodipyrimidine photo-lyase
MFARNDARVGFIHESLSTINEQLKQIGSSLLVKRRNYRRMEIAYSEFDIKEVFFKRL